MRTVKTEVLVKLDRVLKSGRISAIQLIVHCETEERTYVNIESNQYKNKNGVIINGLINFQSTILASLIVRVIWSPKRIL